ncbi:MAG: hypothetical protein HDR51_06640 [Treponema sp.]|nr:hypothetical protein [Treponema sp.]
MHTACIVVPDEHGYTRQQAAAAVRQTLRLGIIHDGERVPLKSVKAVYLLYGDTVSVLKKMRLSYNGGRLHRPDSITWKA